MTTGINNQPAEGGDRYRHPRSYNPEARWRSNGGETRDQVLLNFSDSFENKENTVSTIGDKDLSEAYRLYQAAFNRTPDSAGLSYAIPTRRVMNDETACRVSGIRHLSRISVLPVTLRASSPSCLPGSTPRGSSMQHILI
jgi:hypothetical protein